MKTDFLFYELFRAHPASLFELAGLEAEGEYVFESITVKSTEKRMDGFFRDADGKGSDIFLEVQGYPDNMIYWRQIREIAAHHEQSGSGQPFIAVILFLDRKYDPGNCPITDFKAPNRLIRLYLPECLKAIGDKASPLTILKPLILEDKEKLSEAVPKWKNEIGSLKLPESRNKILIDLLENAILSRFPKLTLKEIQKMIQLTPLDKTVAGQELIQMGIEKGFQTGIEKGKLIARIQIIQELLKQPLTPEENLISQDIEELRAFLSKLEKLS